MDTHLIKPDILDRTPMHRPDPESAAASQLAAFMRRCEERTGHAFPDPIAFHRFSVAEFRLFWRLFLDWSAPLHEGDPEPACTAESCEHATFFPNLRLSYAENLLRLDDDGLDGDRPALTAVHACGGRERFTRRQLRERVARTAGALRRLGVGPGDRVVAVAHNNAEAIIAGLATAAVGATFSSAAPDMGAFSILSRFRQLAPKLLLANLNGPAQAAPVPLSERIGEVARSLPSLTAVVALDGGPPPDGMLVPVHRLAELEAATPPDEDWPRFPFNHPLFILFSSGTTGQPKCIVHGAGGTLLEHLKEHRLHGDLRPSDTLFFHTSAAWMMWNWQLSALACGAHVVVYDGPVTGPDTLWRLVAQERVTVFGTSPPYLQLCRDSGYSPRRTLALDALRAVQSTGSILYDPQFDWVREHVGEVPVQSISGGTDIVGCFVLGNPMLPVYRGEAQCRSLGMDVQALRRDDAPTDARVGELVCRTPFPSRPLGFHGDCDRTRFHDAYFSQNPGMWTHGDLIEFSAEGTARLHGRSDGVLNVNGIRIGPAEIYRILQDIPEIVESMAVEQRDPAVPGRARILLLLVLRPGGTLDAPLRARIRKELARRASPAHVPEAIAAVDELPVTHSNKRSERAARDAANGDTAANAEALKNPACLEQIRRRVAEADAHPEAHPDAGAGDGSMEARLCAIWERVLGVSPIAPEDNFFDLGGSSLRAAQLFREIHDSLHLDLPPATLFHAPTPGGLARLLRDGGDATAAPLLLLKAGFGRPLFVIPGLRGDLLELRALILNLRTERPVYGIRARGLDPRETPLTRVEEMAEDHIERIRVAQPDGPYALAGFSFGGLVAFEMARRLRAAGEEVEFLGLIDSDLHEECLDPAQRRRFRAARPLLRARRKLRVLRGWLNGRRPATPVPLPPLLERLGVTGREAFDAYRPAPYPGRAVFFRATHRRPEFCDPLPIWRRVVEGGVTVTDLACEHSDMIREPNAPVLAERISAFLESAPPPA